MKPISTIFAAALFLQLAASASAEIKPASSLQRQSEPQGSLPDKGCCDNLDINKLADAIYRAEGGSKTRHPYGILAHYQHTTPRQACINTIVHQHAIWLQSHRGEPVNSFVAWLANVYAPLNCSNDPHNLNANWYKNVTHFYNE